MGIHAVCVYCGSSTGVDGSFAGVADALGRLLATSRIEIVYGGGAVGLMGKVADAALGEGGTVVGVIPQGLFAREVGHTGLSTLHEVGSMHERKQLMYDLADAFVALPGGLGTLEELAEITTWAQLGMHQKPIVLVNIDGFWDPLLAQLDRMVAAGLLKPQNRALISAVRGVDDVLGAIERYEAPFVKKWITEDET
jgi:hypothetical protein